MTAPENLIESAPFNLKKLGAHMARPRHHHGWLEESRGRWVAHWYTYVRLDDFKEVRREREKVVGLKAKMRRWEAEKELQRLVDADQSRSHSRPDPRASVQWFYLNRYKPLALARWRGSTAAAAPYAIERHLLQRFGSTALQDLNRFEIQVWLDKLDFSRHYIIKLRNLLGGIVEEAIAQEYLDRNPVLQTAVHGGRPRTDRYLSLAELAALENLQGRELLVFHMLTLLGLRPGELFARRWGDWHGHQLFIADDVWRGQIDATKTAGSRAFVWLPQLLADELAAYRLTVNYTKPEDFIFCFRRGVPLDAHNYLRRVFKPRCLALGVPQITFQTFRRTCSTYLVQNGANIKDVQSHLRHSRATTTLEIYTKEIPESVRDAVEGLSRSLFPKAASFRQGSLFPKERVN